LQSTDEGQQPVEQLIANRRAKLEALYELGQDPYPRRFRVEESVSQVRARYEEKTAEELETEKPEVRIAGRLRAVRGHGKVSFADVSDGAGQLQLYLRKNDLDETSWLIFKQLDLGDFLGVEGAVFRTRAGELSVAVTKLQVLAKALRPLPEKYHGLSDREARARQRYLDLLSNPESREVFEARSFVTHHNTLDMDLYLRIAPELYLKRLIVAGFERIFELNRNFRNEGISTRHNPEFTMLEFYWAYADYELLMDFTEELVAGLAEEVTGGLKVPWGEHIIDFSRPWRRLRMRDAILEYSDLTPEDLVDRSRMEAAARSLDVQRIDERSDGNLFAELFEMTAEPLMINPTFIMDFPRDISPFAKSTPDDPDTVERFELFIGGLEVANAFTELNDPVEQRRRLEAQAAEAGGLVDEDFVLAVEHGMPPTGGEGIGIDRLVMLLTGRQSIRDAILFPQLRPRE